MISMILFNKLVIHNWFDQESRFSHTLCEWQVDNSGLHIRYRFGLLLTNLKISVFGKEGGGGEKRIEKVCQTKWSLGIIKKRSFRSKLDMFYRFANFRNAHCYTFYFTCVTHDFQRVAPPPLSKTPFFGIGWIWFHIIKEYTSSL